MTDTRMVPLKCEKCEGSGWAKANAMKHARRCPLCAGMGVIMVVTEMPPELKVGE